MADVKLPILALCAVALVACGRDEAPPQQPQTEQPQTPPPIPVDESAGPSGRDAMTWIFDHTGADGRARLLYSARSSDEMALNLQCDPGGPIQTLIVRAVPPDRVIQRWPFTLISGEEKTAVVAKADPMENGQVVIRGDVAADDRTLMRLRDTGEISLEDSEQTYVLNAIDATERAAIQNFFTACAPA